MALPVFWLVLSLQAGLMHVGNFPNLEACQAAAKTAWSSSNVVAFTCVQAKAVPARFKSAGFPKVRDGRIFVH